MSDTYAKLHGTTVDRFKIGLNNQRVSLTGVTSGVNQSQLVDRDGNNLIVSSTVFFTAYVVGRGENTAAYEIKGCYLQGTTTVTGYVVDTFVDTADFTAPTISFNISGEMTLTCFGVQDDTISWTAVVDVVSI